MSSDASRRIPLRSLALVFASILSVQCGGAFAASLIPEIGAGTTVGIRLALAAVVVVVVIRPKLRGRSRDAWLAMATLGMSLGLMNWTFYLSLTQLPLGVAVTIEFLGPLGLAAVLSRTVRDAVGVTLALAGVALIAGIGTVSPSQMPVFGIVMAATAGAFWALYTVAAARVGEGLGGAFWVGCRNGCGVTCGDAGEVGGRAIGVGPSCGGGCGDSATQFTHSLLL